MTNPKHRYKILFVDDEPANLNFLRLEFRKEYLVLCANDGLKALKILEDEKNRDIALILTDEKMPGLSGTDLLKKSIGTHPHSIRMLITAYPEENDSIYNRKELEIDMYIRKPINDKIREIKNSIGNAIVIFELRRENQYLNDEIIEVIEGDIRIRNLFSKYLPKEAIEKFEMKDPILLSETVEKEVTILYSDIRGFTSLSKLLHPKDLVDFLNSYFSRMSEIVYKYNGVIDKYIGDAIMATFGLNNSDTKGTEKDASNAIRCAIEMIENLKSFNEKKNLVHLRDIKIGIGINTGRVISGNIGSDYLLDYTVIGDAVNMAAKIEALTCNSPNTILIGENTFKMTSEEIGDTFKKWPTQIRKNSSENFVVYEVWKMKDQ